MLPRPPKFCEKQIGTADYPDGWTCTEHLGDGRVFPCRFACVAEALYSPPTELRSKHGCEYFEPLEMFGEKLEQAILQAMSEELPWGPWTLTQLRDLTLRKIGRIDFVRVLNAVSHLTEKSDLILTAKEGEFAIRFKK